MIGKLAARDSNQVGSLNYKSTKAKIEHKIEVSTIEAITISKVIRIDIDQIMKIGDHIDKTEVDLGMHKIIGEELLEVTQECNKTVEESTETITEMKVMAEIEIGTGLEIGHLPEDLVAIETTGVQTTVGPGQGQEQVQIETEQDVTSVTRIWSFHKVLSYF